MVEKGLGDEVVLNLSLHAGPRPAYSLDRKR